MLDTGCWVLGAGYWILDAGCWMLDAKKAQVLVNQHLESQSLTKQFPPKVGKA
jgi:hypothetical protein